MIALNYATMFVFLEVLQNNIVEERSMSSIPVRVSLPASVAADIGSLKEAIGGILGKLGCQACCSGHDIFFQLQRNVTLRDKLDSPAEAAFSRALPEMTLGSKTVRVGVPARMADNIKEVYMAIDRIAELSGRWTTDRESRSRPPEPAHG